MTFICFFFILQLSQDAWSNKHQIHIILYLVLKSYESWSHTLKGGHKVRVLEKRVLSRISERKGRKSQEKGEKLYTEELRDWCSLPNIIRLKKSIKKCLARYVARTYEGRNVQRFLLGRPKRE